MSVSIMMIPIALALRVVMGKENFETWIESMQVKIPTAFENEKDLVVSVRKSGYDCSKWGGSYKTHVDDGKNFFFWDLIDGKWTAIFSTLDSKEMIRKLIKEIEDKTERHLFLTDPETSQIVVIPTKTFPTNFRDGALLQQTLEDHKIATQVQQDGTIKCEIGSSTLRFSPAKDGAYNVVMENVPDVKSAHHNLSLYDEHYKGLVQQMTCERIKKLAISKNMVLSKEEIQEDQSILLVLTIN